MVAQGSSDCEISHGCPHGTLPVANAVPLPQCNAREDRVTPDREMTQATEQGAEEHISSLPLLARLPTEDVRALASKARLRAFKEGSILVREGEPGDALHVLVSGSVRIAVSSSEGEEATVATLGPGESIGEFAIFDRLPRSATAIATMKTQAFVVTRTDFEEWLRSRPHAAMALLETLSLRLRKTNQGLTDVMFLDLQHRLAKQLCALADSVGATSDDGAVRVQVKQADLGSMLGVTRESVNKELQNFQRRGWLRTSRGGLTITDVNSLRRVNP
jgi:CRP/FNR family transcriptional regulator